MGLVVIVVKVVRIVKGLTITRVIGIRLPVRCEFFRLAARGHSRHEAQQGVPIYLLSPVLVDKSGHDPTFSPQILRRPFDLFHASAGVADVATCRAAVLFNTLVSVGASVGRSGGGPTQIL